MGELKLSHDLDFAIELLGSDYVVVENYSNDNTLFSIEYRYSTLGYSFLIQAKDLNKKIWRIKGFPPLQAQTKYGITLLESTIEDVIKIHGTPQVGLTKDDNVYLARYNGIEFLFNKNHESEGEVFSLVTHYGKKIIGITVL